MLFNGKTGKTACLLESLANLHLESFSNSLATSFQAIYQFWTSETKWNMKVVIVIKWLTIPTQKSVLNKFTGIRVPHPVPIICTLSSWLLWSILLDLLLSTHAHPVWVIAIFFTTLLSFLFSLQMLSTFKSTGIPPLKILLSTTYYILLQ